LGILKILSHLIICFAKVSFFDVEKRIS